MSERGGVFKAFTVFIRAVARLIAQGGRAAGKAATQAGRTAAQQAGRVARASLARLPPSVQQRIPRIFGYRTLPAITFDQASREVGRSMLKTLMAKATKYTIIWGGFTGAGYIVEEIVKACSGDEKISDQEMADIITSRVTAKLAEEAAKDAIRADAEAREKAVEDERQKLREEAARKEQLWQEELARNRTIIEKQRQETTTEKRVETSTAAKATTTEKEKKNCGAFGCRIPTTNALTGSNDDEVMKLRVALVLTYYIIFFVGVCLLTCKITVCIIDRRARNRRQHQIVDKNSLSMKSFGFESM
jgi:hypothetical protein